MIHLTIIKGRESRDDGYAEGFGAADQPARQDAPGALVVANADRSGETVDCDRQFDAIFKDFAGQGRGDLHTAGAAVMPATAIGYVGPTLQEYTTLALLFDGVQAAFQAYKVVRGFGFFAGQAD